MYLFINDDKTIIDYSKTIYYLKRVPESGVYIFTDNFMDASLVKSNRTGNIYFLKDIFPVNNCVYIETIDDNEEENIICGYTKYGIVNETFSIINNIPEIQEQLQTKNKEKFTEYLKANPYEYNGKKYGTTLEDQLEINLILSQAQSNSTVSWHATGEVNEEMSIADLIAIQAGIKEFIQEPYHKMQEYKKKIYDCNDIKELTAMTFEY